MRFIACCGPEVTFCNIQHQPIKAPTAGAQDFLMNHTLGERAVTNYAGPVGIGGC
jgi:hypothetical protein